MKNIAKTSISNVNRFACRRMKAMARRKKFNKWGDEEDAENQQETNAESEATNAGSGNVGGDDAGTPLVSTQIGKTLEEAAKEGGVRVCAFM